MSFTSQNAYSFFTPLQAYIYQEFNIFWIKNA
jgi:hypothetical protein